MRKLVVDILWNTFFLVIGITIGILYCRTFGQPPGKILLKVIYSDSLSVTYPIDYISPDSIVGDSKVAKDLRYYYQNIK